MACTEKVIDENLRFENARCRAFETLHRRIGVFYTRRKFAPEKPGNSLKVNRGL